MRWRLLQPEALSSPSSRCAVDVTGLLLGGPGGYASCSPLADMSETMTPMRCGSSCPAGTRVSLTPSATVGSCSQRRLVEEETAGAQSHAPGGSDYVMPPSDIHPELISAKPADDVLTVTVPTTKAAKFTPPPSRAGSSGPGKFLRARRGPRRWETPPRSAKPGSGICEKTSSGAT
jgi:hypothetical protein